MPPLTPAQHLERLELEADAFATLLSDTAPDLPVPSCPGWSVRDLAEHVGGVHQWCAHAVERGDPDATLTPPDPHDDLATWYDEQARRMLEVLRATDPEAPAWSFGPPHTAAFWMRRQAHEVAMHRWDAAAARGETTVLDEEFALDGLAEVAGMFFPRQVRLGRIEPLSASLTLVTTGGARVVLHGDGTGEPPAVTDAVVRGPAEALLLLVWKRTPLADPRLVVEGDAAAALDTALVP